MDPELDSFTPRRRRSKDYPLDFSPNPPRPLFLPVSPFLRVYESSRQRLEDIISELHQDPSEKQRKLPEHVQVNLQERGAGGAWGLVTAAAALGVALVSAQLLGWCYWEVVLVSLLVGGLFAVLVWARWRVELPLDAAVDSRI